MKIRRLTKRQKDFAAEHHDVLTNFLKYRNLPEEEFYDVVVFRFLHAVQQYDEREELRRYKFATVARNQMRSALSNYFVAQRRRENALPMLSLDYPVAWDSELTLGDTLIDQSVDVCEEVCRKLSRPKKYAASYTSQSSELLQFA